MFFIPKVLRDFARGSFESEAREASGVAFLRNDAASRLQIVPGRSQIGGLQREEDAEDGAAGFMRLPADAAAHGDAAAMLVDDGLADPQAEAGTGCALGGEEGLKDARLGGLVYAASCICHGDVYALRAGKRLLTNRGAEGEAAAIPLHGIDGVADEVGEYLTDLAVVGLYGGQFAIAPLDGDRIAAQARLVEGDHAFQQIVHVGVHRPGALAVEAQGLGGDVGDAVELLLRDAQVLLRSLVEAGGTDEKEAVGDGLERIVDLMRDGGGESSCGSQLLGAPHDLFAAFLFGEIDEKDSDLFRCGGRFRRIGCERREGDQHGKILVTAGAAHGLEGAAWLARSDGLQTGEYCGPLGAKDAAEVDCATAQLLLAITEQPLDAGVGILDGAIGLGDDEADGHGLHQTQEALLAGPQCPFGIELEATGARFAYLALDGRNEPREILLGDIVMGTGAHRIDGSLFADGAGHDDEGDIASHVFQQAESGGSAEARQVEVRQHYVPFCIRLVERTAHIVGGFNSVHDGPVAGALEVASQKMGVILVVLYQEDAQWSGFWLAFDLLWLFRGTHRVYEEGSCQS